MNAIQNEYRIEYRMDNVFCIRRMRTLVYVNVRYNSWKQTIFFYI